MATWKVSILVYTIVGQEWRILEVKARTMVAAERKAARIMGNREFHIQKAELWSAK